MSKYLDTKDVGILCNVVTQKADSSKDFSDKEEEKEEQEM